MLVLVVIVVMSLLLTTRMKYFQREQLTKKDSRIARIVETVTHLKIIKLNVWEDTFKNSVGDLRSKELSSIRMFLTLQAIQSFMWNCAVFLMAFVCFSYYSLSVSSTLSVETAFVSLALLNSLRGSFR